MNSLARTLLLLSTLLCAFTDAPIGCGAVPNFAAAAAASSSSSSQDGTALDAALATSRLIRRSVADNLTSMFENLVVQVATLPLRLLRDLGRVGRFIFDRINALYRSTVFLYNQLGPPGILANLDGVRNRRSLPSLSDVLALNPIATLARTIRSAQNMTEQQLENVLSSLAYPGYNFLLTKVLPWLRDALETVGKNPNLPSSLRTAIVDIDALYRFLQLLGFAGLSEAG